ncbi:N-(5'-phosphoribosyl)anthranilate isomerase [Tateyamaria sp. SN6-1]|uniref:N-(5'-phosphoribosyl)anthranilate isomerase n=1 Tax=Tateyamaria sp. SN6-1 TaxID=3092148 RepID=UPI0039F5E618
MQELPDYLTPEAWLDQIFSAQSAMRGGVVRRRVKDVERLVGRPLFREELRKRGYRAIENNGNFVIFCNRAPLRLLE